MSTKDPVFQAIKARRATRSFTEEPVAHELLVRLMESARWAPSAGNRRIHKFVVIEDLPTIHLIHAFAPGMLSNPTALIVICTDRIKAATEGVKLAADSTTWIDVGAAAQNIMLTALELGLALVRQLLLAIAGCARCLTCPIIWSRNTSFNSAIQSRKRD